jgi:hypothetical protein
MTSVAADRAGRRGRRATGECARRAGAGNNPRGRATIGHGSIRGTSQNDAVLASEVTSDQTDTSEPSDRRHPGHAGEAMRAGDRTKGVLARQVTAHGLADRRRSAGTVRSNAAVDRRLVSRAPPAMRAGRAPTCWSPATS